MVDLMRDTGGIVEHINPSKLVKPITSESVETEMPATPAISVEKIMNAKKPAAAKVKRKSNGKK
jgi:hypothetical protein